MPVQSGLYRARRAAWFANKVCAWCSSTIRLELDHIDPATKDPRLRVHAKRVWQWGEAQRSAELAKCQPLCRICHLSKSAAGLRLGSCPNGHEYSYYPSGRKYCGVCVNTKKRKRYRRQRPK
jgi:hypothetical protein